ncbi:MAG: hypothetical protein BWX96_03314 [Bacteroidetes bacterium ADurb.Bin145]|nr:MAG: hypothetical protein BWX96_03314 [Bacteroidetes bacterium ADurb.Bin145]
MSKIARINGINSIQIIMVRFSGVNTLMVMGSAILIIVGSMQFARLLQWAEWCLNENTG